MDNNTEFGEQKESFRDRVSSIDKKGKRIWIYPKKPSGRFHSARALLTIFLLALLFLTPFIKLRGEPLILLDVISRKFVIFGKIFWPQDFYIFALGFLALIFFIVLFTAVYGRLWCGWLCPQTVFMEMVFRKIEYWLEGDYVSQQKLNKQNLSVKKTFIKSAKHSIFLLISLILSNIIIIYIIGSDKLFEIASSPVSNYSGGFLAMIFLTLTIYFIFAWFREQACTFVCPYARLQSVLLDKNSIVVGYDFIRGEPREAPKKRNEMNSYGDCIDCGFCVRVCPTAIDIRNGVQLECINCTACIDACDEIMDRLKKPKGLIRFTSLNQIETKEKFRITPRIIIYTAFLTLLFSLVVIFTLNRSNIQATILHTPGALPQILPDGNIINLYTAKVSNKTLKEVPVEFRLEDTQGKITIPGREKLNIIPGSQTEIQFLITLPKSSVNEHIKKIRIGLYSEGKKVETTKTSFLWHN